MKKLFIVLLISVAAKADYYTQSYNCEMTDIVTNTDLIGNAETIEITLDEGGFVSGAVYGQAVCPRCSYQKIYDLNEELITQTSIIYVGFEKSTQIEFIKTGSVGLLSYLNSELKTRRIYLCKLDK